MAQLDANALRNKAETCRSLSRHVTDERALRVLRELIVEYTTKAEELDQAFSRGAAEAHSVGITLLI
jgi:hypothetical protein